MKWYVPEESAEVAGKLKKWILSSAHRMVVPTLFFDEITNILWKKEALLSEHLPRTTREILWEILRLPLHVYLDKHELLPKALEIAGKSRVTAYDAIYVATAIQNQAIFITADNRLIKQLAETPFASSMIPLNGWEKLKP